MDTYIGSAADVTLLYLDEHEYKEVEGASSQFEPPLVPMTAKRVKEFVTVIPNVPIPDIDSMKELAKDLLECDLEDLLEDDPVKCLVENIKICMDKKCLDRLPVPFRSKDAVPDGTKINMSFFMMLRSKVACLLRIT